MGKKAQEYASGTLGDAIKAVQGGKDAILNWAIGFLKDLEPIKTIIQIKDACTPWTKLPGCAVEVLGKKLPSPIDKFIKAAMGPGDWGDKLKELGKWVVDLLKSAIAKVEKEIKSLAENTLKPFLEKAQAEVMNRVFNPIVNGLQNFLKDKIQGAVEPIVRRVLAKMGSVKEQAEKIGGMIDETAAKIDQTAAGVAGKVGAAKSTADDFEKKLSQFLNEVPGHVTDMALEWIREQALPWVMEKVQSLISGVWTWAQGALSLVRNAVQGLVGSIPFAGGALAVVVGGAVDAGWEQLKKVVEEFVGGKIKDIWTFLANKAKSLLAGAKENVGALMQGIVEALKWPIAKVKEHVLPLVATAIAKYQKIRARVSWVQQRVKNEIANAQAMADGYKKQFEAAKAQLLAAKLPVPEMPKVVLAAKLPLPADVSDVVPAWAKQTAGQVPSGNVLQNTAVAYPEPPKAASSSQSAGGVGESEACAALGRDDGRPGGSAAFGVNWGNGKAYFFNGGKYVKYDIATDKPEEGYPRPVAGNWGKGFWTGAGPDAAVNAGNGFVYFFKGDEYIKYDMKDDGPVAGYPKKIAGNWPGLWDGGVDAAVEWDKDTAYFFKGSEYIKYDMKADKAAPGYPKEINNSSWPGICMNRIQGAVNWGNGKVFFFKAGSYVKYDIAADKVDPGYPQPVNNQTWPGLP